MASINSMSSQPDNTAEAQINLRELTLNQWVNESLGEDFIAQYGLKDSTQVVSFLNTHTGKDVRAMIVKELIEIVKQEESIFNKIIEEKMLGQQLLAYLLLKLAYKENEQFKRLCETVQAQIDKILNKDKNASTSKAEANIPVELLIHLESLQKEAQDITRAIESEKNELIKVERQLEQMNADRSLFVQRHRDCEILIDDLLAIDDHSITTDTSSTRNRLINVRDAMASVEVLPISVNQRPDVMTAPIHAPHIERPRTFHSLKQEIHDTINILLNQGRLEDNNIFGATRHPVTIDYEDLTKLLKLSKYFLVENSKVGVNHYDSQIEILTSTANSRKNNIYTLEKSLTNTLNKTEKIQRESDKYSKGSWTQSDDNRFISRPSQPPGLFAHSRERSTTSPTYSPEDFNPNS
ncbi:hypothetical protein [Legionella gresilensis]|uniref:hypothetical protein n=1 Tax=Legionella gresilensis TaxID=91823 RepID=UPI0010411C80|nr:hypothetical protein [Legionella gresilensis]